MSEKSEKAMELFKQGYNCSQAVLGVFCEELGMDFDTAMKLSSSFGGGMGRMREVCGTVSGMFMAAGLAFASSSDSATEKGAHYKRIQELAQRFRDDNGSIICRELLQGTEKKKPCVELVGNSVEIFENYLQEQKAAEQEIIG